MYRCHPACQACLSEPFWWYTFKVLPAAVWLGQMSSRCTDCIQISNLINTDHSVWIYIYFHGLSFMYLKKLEKTLKSYFAGNWFASIQHTCIKRRSCENPSNPIRLCRVLFKTVGRWCANNTTGKCPPWCLLTDRHLDTWQDEQWFDMFWHVLTLFNIHSSSSQSVNVTNSSFFRGPGAHLHGWKMTSLLRILLYPLHPAALIPLVLKYLKSTRCLLKC